ncbi:MAG TPA: DUF2017 family protein [Verrucomicrobiae bacterium]|nr:DUF2017 family protein [Verrucomicrobiae bacterium]
MIELRVQPLDEKHIRISGIAPVLAIVLRELPEILEQRDSPDAQDRLFPNPTPADEKINKEWQQMISPELRHLFVSAGETVARDLAGLAASESSPDTYEMTFPVEHLKAWMTALNQARLILAEIHQIDEENMSVTDFDPQNPKHVAAFRIHLLGYLLHLFVERETGDEPADTV